MTKQVFDQIAEGLKEAVIPAWAIKSANDAIGFRPADFPPRYWLDARDSFARALVAERERCAKIAEDEDGEFWYSGQQNNQVVGQRICSEIAAAIRNQEPER